MPVSRHTEGGLLPLVEGADIPDIYKGPDRLDNRRLEHVQGHAQSQPSTRESADTLDDLRDKAPLPASAQYPALARDPSRNDLLDLFYR